MFFMYPLIIFSDKQSSEATCLFALPIATSRRIALTFAECFVGDVGRDFFGLRGSRAMAAMNVANGVDQYGPQAALEQTARRTRLQHAHGPGIAPAGGEHDDASGKTIVFGRATSLVG